MAEEHPMTEYEQWLVGQGNLELAERMRDLRARFHAGDLVELIDDARAGEHVSKGDLPDEFKANVTYKVHDLGGLFLRFKKDDNRSLWRVSSAPLSRLPYQTAHSRFFQPVARDPAVPTKIAALSTVFEKLQSDQARGLKRKLEETTLEMERARMEREDFRQGGGPSDVCGSPGDSSNVSLRRYVEDLQDQTEGDRGTIAEARNLLDMGQSSEARRILNEALSDPESDTESDASDGREP